MDRTPQKEERTRANHIDPTTEQKENRFQNAKLKKPPPITPRRFTRFFTPRPRNTDAAVKTSRTALKVLLGSAVNVRNNQSLQTNKSDLASSVSTPRGKKRKLSFATDDSAQSSPVTRVSFLHASQDIRSSPTIPERRSPSRKTYRDVDFTDEEEAETDVDLEEEESQQSFGPVPRVVPYRSQTTSGSLLSTRLSGMRIRAEASSSALWQHETGDFYSSMTDVNTSFSQHPVALPFSVATCNTNPIIATGDEEGTIRIIDSSVDNQLGLTRTFLQMRPHDNAIMDLEFSEDDAYLATACGDQSCQIIDMHTQATLFTLGGHRCSVKRISFQPGSGSKVLASCGRDGQLNFWDLRCNDNKNYRQLKQNEAAASMTAQTKFLLPTHGIREAHAAGPKSSKAANAQAKPNLVPGRADFSVTCLSFLGKSRPHLLATASEVDTTVKIWDIRTHHSNNRRAPTPLSRTEEPKSHAYHRCFGVTSLVVSGDGSRMYTLSRDHTVYAYSTAHLILGSSTHLSNTSKPSKLVDSGKQGLGPLYGLRHPSLRVQSFWPRLAIRPASGSHSELLAVGSTEDCAVLFPTNERYLTKSATKLPFRHTAASRTLNRPGLRPSIPTRSASATSSDGQLRTNQDEGITIYHHGTPLIRGHDKEVTSLAWTSEGSLITASDDYTVRCWREDPVNARRMRDQGEKNGERWKRGWADVGLEDYDEEY